GQCRRQALPAKIRRDRYTYPAAFDDLLIGVLEALRSRHAAVGGTLAAFLVANPVERCQHFLAEFGRFAQHRFYDIRRGIGEAREVSVAVKMKDVVEQEQRVIDWGFVDWHDRSPRQRAARC